MKRVLNRNLILYFGRKGELVVIRDKGNLKCAGYLLSFCIVYWGNLWLDQCFGYKYFSFFILYGWLPLFCVLYGVKVSLYDKNPVILLLILLPFAAINSCLLLMYDQKQDILLSLILAVVLPLVSFVITKCLNKILSNKQLQILKKILWYLLLTIMTFSLTIGFRISEIITEPYNVSSPGSYLPMSAAYIMLFIPQITLLIGILNFKSLDKPIVPIVVFFLTANIGWIMNFLLSPYKNWILVLPLSIVMTIIFVSGIAVGNLLYIIKTLIIKE